MSPEMLPGVEYGLTEFGRKFMVILDTIEDLENDLIEN
jgi:DNA-binding HxlR family transcriptional regulator